ncbi:hypothetical protein [Halopelagius longus]|uniref:Uncharacterized protein n=1 Tax=Halopelagius longus TaxID=1236180 RepID=A0A1H1G406_9EURY|nr:hypothetical protein [Halopelagius longus]RDI69856.1 hypothetical protein DWB78_17045 [Halopelagius longus]SDR07954.1 hypothetical protein SAMN05216278_3508 [Halopelagius longus]
MSSVSDSGESSGWGRRRHGVVGTIRNSVTLTIAVMGLLFFLGGYLINTGIWAAMLAVWGTALFLFGVTTYGIIWWQRR